MSHLKIVAFLPALGVGVGVAEHVMSIMKPTKLNQTVTLLARGRKLPISILGSNPDYANRCFLVCPYSV